MLSCINLDKVPKKGFMRIFFCFFLLLVSPLSAYSSSDECEAAAQFAEKETGLPWQEVYNWLLEVEEVCEENEDCWVQSAHQAAQGEWTVAEADAFLTQLYNYDCDI